MMALLWARREGYRCEAVAVHYGQRHFAELAAAWEIAKALDVPFETMEMSAFSSIAPSRLTGRIGESVVVPNRNAFLISVAGAVAIGRGIDRIVLGCNADDAAGFPDCRESFIWAAEEMLRKATGDERDLELVTPWLHLSKGEALRLFARDDEAMVHIRRSVSCYEGRVPGCGVCPACVKRARAFSDASIPEVR